MQLKVLISKVEGVFLQPRKKVEYSGILVASSDYSTIIVRDEFGGFHREFLSDVKSSRWTPVEAEIISLPNPQFGGSRE